MEYFYDFQNWLNGTRLYQEVLKEQAEHGKDKQLKRQGRKGADHGRLGKKEE